MRCLFEEEARRARLLAKSSRSQKIVGHEGKVPCIYTRLDATHFLRAGRTRTPATGSRRIWPQT